MGTDLRERPQRHWNVPVDAASLAAFRILFGLLLAAAMLRFIALGWIDEIYLRPPFHFTWDGFAWVRPFSPSVMRAWFWTLTALALAVALGFRSRLCAALFCAGFSYTELIDKTAYLNHYYLVSLLVGLLALVPAHQLWSVDAWRRKTPAPQVVPAWSVDLLRFQLAVVYIFAGLAKLNADWLIDAQPLRMWLAARSDLTLVGPWLMHAWAAQVFSWGGAAFDLSIVPLLMWRRTRAIAYGAVIAFHVSTWILFPIGMFPWIMIVATTIFFDPGWPRRRLPVRHAGCRAQLSVASAFNLHPIGGAALVAYAAIQIAAPLRGYWPGADPAWTNRGFNFAWRVMLDEKAGVAEFTARDPSTGRTWPVRTLDYVTERQARFMAQDPEMIGALARQIAQDFRARGIRGVQVRADTFASLNGRPMQRLIDPTVDLAAAGSAVRVVPLQR